MPEALEFFATTPRGMEALLGAELRALGASRVRENIAGAAFSGPLALGYRICLWSRTASRVLLRLARFPAATPEALYRGVRTVAWDQHLSPDGTLAVNVNLARSGITHSHFAALKVKDAIVDQLREAHGVRPSVDTGRPHVRINLSLRDDRATLGLDLAGESLHRRGYREAAPAAPLKENLAAAILLRANWPAMARSGAPLLDPMCGSGTLPIEAALMAGDIAPGLLRPYYGFLGWRGHDTRAWEDLVSEAQQRRQEGLRHIPPIAGYDVDEAAIRMALANVKRAGLDGHVLLETRELSEAGPPAAAGTATGLVVVNPPYGERLGQESVLVSLYARLGQTLVSRFPGWRAAVFTGNQALARRVGLRPRRSFTLYNGPIESRLLLFELKPQSGAGQARPSKSSESAVSSGAEMLANRLRKNLKHLGRWARREGIDCYRLYDSDLPEYALAVDVYEGAKVWAHVQEYTAPATVDPGRAEERLYDALAVIPSVLQIPPEHLFFKVRRRQRGTAQYEKLARTGELHEVREGGLRFLVNFTDHLDTGLFLDHRPTRGRVRTLASGRRFLNLFGYTGTATVYAAAGGAPSTVTVDMSATYLDWARRNLALNGFDQAHHHLVRADCLAWLEEHAAGDRPAGRFGLIFLDPPTFSNSKRMGHSFDIQRDHTWLITQATRLLEPDGELIFSTNRRRFKMDRAVLEGLRLEDITRSTIPQDFARNPRIHSCWRIRPGGRE